MKKLYIKVILILFGVLAALGIFHVVLTSYMADEYQQEIKQQVHRDLAQDIMKWVLPIAEENLDKNLTNHIIQSVTSINPNVDVYLLKPDGEIYTSISYAEDLELESVELGPVKEFISGGKQKYLKGSDPRNRTSKNIFSAAEMRTDKDEFLGYVYVVLDNDKHAEVVSELTGTYITQLGIQSFGFALLIALLVGIWCVWLITRNLRSYLTTVGDFKNGNLSARVNEKAKGDFPILGETFNLMAENVEGNMKKMKSMEAIRTEMMANISHDLRTPVMIIQGYAETLMMKKQAACNESIEKYLTIILNGTQKLSRLINQLFDYSKLETLGIRPEMDAFQIRELIENTYSNYEIIANKKEIDLQIQMEEDLPLVYADTTLIERVLQNLMDNAIKFTPNNGYINIRLNEVKDKIRIKIHNTGKVIPVDQLSSIFQRYQKLDKTFIKGNNGAGLGLAIVKKILDLHDAEIKVVSKKGLGTSFIFELPKSIRKIEEELISTHPKIYENDSMSKYSN